MVDPAPGSQVELLRSIVRTHDLALMQALERAGFGHFQRGQFVLLQAVAGGITTPRALCTQLGTTQQYVSRCLASLTAWGYVVHHSAGADRRLKRFEVTGAGRRVVNLARAWQARCLTGLPDDVVSDLSETLTTMSRVLGTDAPGEPTDPVVRLSSPVTPARPVLLLGDGEVGDDEVVVGGAAWVDGLDDVLEP